MTSSHLSNVGAMHYPLGHTSSANQMPDTRAYGLQSAALLALSQIGATNVPSAAPAGSAAGVTGAATAATTGTATAGPSASNAVQTFLQSLYAALQAQAALDNSTPANAAGGTSSASANAAAAVHGHHGHHAHHGGAGLSSLVQQLGASAGAPSTADPSSTVGSSSSASSTLEQSFNSLVTATGESSNGQATLANFLHAFASDLSSRPAGTLLSARA
ncbi:MAG: hypothetical protein ACREUT_02090 [Steroidobacteraceae bacterium]